jgi:hypothetical protein
MECVRNRKKPNADIIAGYNHSIATIMCTAALRTGDKASFDEQPRKFWQGVKCSVIEIIISHESI